MSASLGEAQGAEQSSRSGASAHDSKDRDRDRGRSRTRRELGPRRARHLVELLALVWVVLIAVAFIGRIAFPLELEWMEGGSLHHALRLLEGQPIYAAPSIDFVPFLYTPLYPGLLALFGALGVPLGLVLGRAISVAAVLAIAAGLWRLVAAENKPRAHRAAAVGLFLAGYVLCFRWYDVARADSMMFALLLWGVVLIRSARDGWRRPILAGILVALAFWTKQTAAVLILASGLAAIALGLKGRLWALTRYTAAVAVVVLGGLVVGVAWTDGWLWTYIYELHQTHGFNHERFEKKTWGMLLHAGPFLALLALTLTLDDLGRLVARVRRGRPGLRRLRSIVDRGEAAAGRRFWGIMGLFALLVSALGYSTQWAEPNAFIPAVIFGAAYLGVSIPVGGLREVWALGLVAAQLIFAAVLEPVYQPIQDRGPSAIGESYRWQDRARTIPVPEARAAAATLRAELLSFREGDGSARGELFAFQRPWWSVLAGGRGHVASMGLSDVTPPDRARVRAEIVAALRSGRFAELWFEGEAPRWLRGALAGRYRVAQRRVGAARVRPWTGYMSEAGMVTPYRGAQLRLVRTAARPPPTGARLLADFEGGASPPGFRLVGRAFARPHPAIVGDLPVLGPHGGELLLGSARRRSGLRSTGSIETAAFSIPEGGALELLVGVSAGPREGLRLRIIDDGDGVDGDVDVDVDVDVEKGRERSAEGSAAEVVLPLPPLVPWQLSTLRWSVPEELAGHRLRLVIEDQSRRSAIFVDDLWVLPGAK